MTIEADALTMWCPFARASTTHESDSGGYAATSDNRGPNGDIWEEHTCLGSSCMAWRWAKDIEQQKRDVGCEVLLADKRFDPCIRIVNAVSYNYVQEGLPLSTLIADTKSGNFRRKPNVGKKSLEELRHYLDLMQELSLEPQKAPCDGYCGLAGKP